MDDSATSFHEDESVCLFLKQVTKLRECQTQHNEICVYRHEELGHILVLNGEIQHVEAYEQLYHEQLVHLAAAFHPAPRKALVLGGGSLFAARELLKYQSIDDITLCDHDCKVLDVCVDMYPELQQVVSHPSFHMAEKDVYHFLREIRQRYDLIINDCFNFAQASAEHGVNWYTHTAGLLNENGICSDIAYRHLFDRRFVQQTLRYIREQKNVCFAPVFVPEYPGIVHLQTLWGKNAALNQETIETLNQEQKVWSRDRKSPLNSFIPDCLNYYLSLPPYFLNLLK